MMATTDATTTAVAHDESSSSHSEKEPAQAQSVTTPPPSSPTPGSVATPTAAAGTAAAPSAASSDAHTADTSAPDMPPSSSAAIANPADDAATRSSVAKPQLELELDKLQPGPAGTSGEGHTDGSDEYSSDLGTPLGFHEGGFGESSEDFSAHRFIGPSVPGDDASARELHGVRRVQIHLKPPRFVSELATVEAERRRLSRASVGSRSTSSSSSRSLSAAAAEPATYSATFTEPATLGFSTDVVVTHSNEVAVLVARVERESPAERAGLAEGDVLLSVNGQRLDALLSEGEVLEVVRSATVPRTLVLQRATSASVAAVAVATSSSAPASRSASDAAEDKSKGEEKSKPGRKGGKQLFGRLSSAVGYGSAMLGSALKRKSKVVHANSFCDGCGMDPISGPLWTCSVCPNYSLCGDCYDHGTHGLENSDAMQTLQEALVQHKLEKKCKQFTPAFLLSLRRDICKGRPDKFEYMGSWIADIVVGTAASKITVRGIEIPALSPMARQRFVSNLMPLVSNRTDIEVNIEWLPDDAERASVDLEDIRALGAADHDELEKLRIWISDKKTRTTSPFA